MCGIAGILDLKKNPIPYLQEKLEVMNSLIEHRGPDGTGTWINSQKTLGFTHRRLTILELSPLGAQPMEGPNSTCLTYNGEVYNYIELQQELAATWKFKSHSDTEVILASYSKYQESCVEKLRGMFAFALWDEKRQTLFCARDRFGIKPFYYTLIGNTFLFASEAKALLPFLENIETDLDALGEYFTFQYLLGEKTLFKGIYQLLPGHSLTIRDGEISVKKYWDLLYSSLEESNEHIYQDNLKAFVSESLELHHRSDVPVGSYLSGGVDSSLIAILSAEQNDATSGTFHGKFTDFPGYDESYYAKVVSETINQPFYCVDIKSEDFKNKIQDVIYYLDFPIAGPGAFPQYMVSELASKHVKVILGGQGGDEIFGGYARYMIGYLERALYGAISPQTAPSLPLSLAQIAPNLGMLQEYIPLLKSFWSEGMFGEFDHRYFRLCDRSHDFKDEINEEFLNREKTFEKFRGVFNDPACVHDQDFLNKMLRFDLKYLLPGLLQVEDRMSMAHGLESRVPFLDHPLAEYVAKIPTPIKFQGGKMKHLLHSTFNKSIPEVIKKRRDKMGFPVPLKEWFGGPLETFVSDILKNSLEKKRPYLKNINMDSFLKNSGRYSRKVWALLSLELWYSTFHDRQSNFKMLLKHTH